MPLTAVHKDRGVLDATDDDLGCGWSWDDVYRVRPRVVMSCRTCGHGLHAKVSSTGLRFFAHDRNAPACPGTGESVAHHLLKSVLIRAAREAGFDAQLEVDGPGGRWRADVLVTAPGGRRIALEAQLSPISRNDVLERTRRFEVDQVEVCWFTDRQTRWLGSAPAVQICTTSWQITAGVTGFFTAPCYCDRVCPLDEHGFWERTEPTLADFTARMLQGELVPADPADSRAAGHWGHGWVSLQDVTTAGEFNEAQATIRRSVEYRASFDPKANAVLVERWQSRHGDAERQRLYAAAREWGRQHTGRWCDVLAARTGAEWRRGIPLGTRTDPWALARPFAVIRPHPDCIEWNGARDQALIYIVGSTAEHEELASGAPANAQIIIL